MSAELERPLRQDAARNRERLIAAARSAFADHGPDVPLEEIARAAGVSRTTLYRNFETREQLAAEIYTDNMDRIVQRAAELAGRPDGVVALVDFVLDIQVSGNQGLARVMIPGSDRALALALGGRLRAALRAAAGRRPSGRCRPCGGRRRGRHARLPHGRGRVRPRLGRGAAAGPPDGPPGAVHDLAGLIGAVGPRPTGRDPYIRVRFRA